MKRYYFCAVIFLTFLVFFTGTASSQIANGDFEETVTIPETSSYFKRMESKKWEFEKPLIFPKGWYVNAALSEGVYKIITDKTEAQSGNNCIYLKGAFTHQQLIKVTQGDEIEVSVYVKGQKGNEIRIQCYAYGRKDDNKRTNVGGLNLRAKAESEWTKQVWNFTIPENIKNKKVHEIKIALYSPVGAYFDNLTIEHKKVQ
ncbi:hypothetical protein M0P98_00875 [bacterium]|nr:hypothetical protein [bacterium]